MTDQPITDILKSRRTIHRFKPEPPPAKLIREALDLARWVPNHKKTEPWKFYWLGPEAKQAIIEFNCELLLKTKGPQRAADKRKSWNQKPGWIVVTAPRSEDPVRQQEDYASCCCSIHNMSLFLWSRGIGLKWTSGPVTHEPHLLELIGANPEHEYCAGLVWYGYPDQTPVQSRKPLEEVLVIVP